VVETPLAFPRCNSQENISSFSTDQQSIIISLYEVMSFWTALRAVFDPATVTLSASRHDNSGFIEGIQSPVEHGSSGTVLFEVFISIVFSIALTSTLTIGRRLAWCEISGNWVTDPLATCIRPWPLADRLTMFLEMADAAFRTVF
jgi:hypothetical protein